MENIIARTGMSEDPFALASLEHAALRAGEGALREVFTRVDRLGAAGLEDGSWARCAFCGDPGPDPLPDPETPDDYEMN